MEDGIALLFEKFSDFKKEDVKINYFNGDLFVEFGDNVFLLTKNIIENLLIKPKVYFCVGNFNEYEAFGYLGCFEFNTNFLAQIKGAVLIIEMQEKNQNVSSQEEIQKEN